MRDGPVGGQPTHSRLEPLLQGQLGNLSALHHPRSEHELMAKPVD